MTSKTSSPSTDTHNEAVPGTIIPPKPAPRFLAPDIDGPRILAWDIETRVGVAYAFSPRIEYLAPSNWVEKPGGLLCLAGRWIGSGKQTWFAGLDKMTHEEMLAVIWWALETSTHLVSWNGASFDTKKVMTEFFRLGWAPPTPSIELDLMRVARSRFSFVSNKLDEVAKEVIGDSKVKHSGLSLWVRCQEGDPKAWAEMRKYNKQDVDLLEPLFERFRPWMRKQLWWSAEGCIVCDSKNIIKRGQVLAGTQGKPVQRYSCTDCGALMREPLTLLKKTLRPL